MTEPESVLCVVPKASHKLDEWMLYITNYRIVVGRFSAWGTALGGIAGMAIDASRRDKMKQIDPNAILMKDKRAFEISYSKLAKVDFKGSMLGCTIVFHFNDGSKRKFGIASKKDYQVALKTLQPILGVKAEIIK